MFRCLAMLSPFTVLALVCGTSLAQDVFPVRPTWISLPQGSSDVALGDIDRDGDLDLVSARSLSSSLYLNDGRRLDRLPSWNTGGEDQARSVALGDLDHDGDLDAIFGTAAGLRLYRGNGVDFGRDAVWSLDNGGVASVVLGDVDDDGDLDLVSVNVSAPSTLHLNVNGIFQSVPAWVAPSGVAARDAALGDVNHDGMLDLVLVGFPSKRLFLNSQGSFADPAWELTDSLLTTAVALGDVDLDGALDLVCAHWDAPATLYQNTGSSFGDTPRWQSGSNYRFTSVALGDLQLDGDIDAVFGNEQDGAKLFLNDGGVLQPVPDWQAATVARTSSVALGDVNGDGVLDLVCGNFDATDFLFDGAQLFFSAIPAWNSADIARDFALGDIDADGDIDLVLVGEQSTAFYRNDGGTLSPQPVWTAPIPAADVALGDVDEDGDLDLVCANALAVNSLWLFEVGTFASRPAWEAPFATATRSIALGDIDSDGRLDLICGNDSLPSEIWFNDGNGFGNRSAWKSTTILPQPSLAVGDVNRDGWLDVVIGSRNGTHLFVNGQGRISSDPSWSLLLIEDTTALLLGDMDSDGDLDLVCGNDRGPNTLHRNVDGEFEAASTWLPLNYFGRVALALGDVDADGDLDLLSVGEGLGEGSSLYLNTGAGLANQPDWEDPNRLRTFAVACADVDGDGDLDALLGRENELGIGVSELHDGRTAPAAGYDQRHDRPRLPNEPAQLHEVHVEANGSNIRVINFTAYDAESDSIWIVAEYQEAGRATNWFPVVSPGIVPPGPEIARGPFATAPDGVPAAITWDLSGLAYGRYWLALRLRTISHAQHAGVIQYVASHLTDIGSLLTRRPFLQVDGLDMQSTLVFPAVTIGDTVTTDFDIVNLGNDTLRVMELTPLFGDALQLEVRVPLNVAPGSRKTVMAHHAPTRTTQDQASIIVRSNDPTHPFFTFDVLAPSLALQVRTQVLSLEDTVRLAQPLTIQTLPDDHVVVEKATFFYRLPGAIDAFSPIMMRQLPGETARDGPWLANLDGSLITELGLEYYVEVENSGLVAMDPPKAPMDVYRLEVQPPVSFTVKPLETATSGFLSGRAISVVADIPTGALFKHGTLFWRRGGATNWFEEPLVPLDFDTYATIPDSGVAERGVEFYVEMQTQTVLLREPLDSPFEPHRIQIRIPNLKEPTAHLGGRYHMVSFPLEFESDVVADQLLTDTAGFGTYQPTRWRLFRYDPLAAANVELSAQRRDLFTVDPGSAFWLVSQAGHQVDTAPSEGISTSTSRPGKVITLTEGWNQIGNPFPFRVAWLSVDVAGELDAPVAFDPTLGATGDYSDKPVSVLEAFTGYFVLNRDSTPRTLIVPPIEAQAPSRLLKMVKEPPEPLWTVRLVATTEAAVDGANRFGMDPSASDHRDTFDAPEPPPPPGAWVQLAFSHDGVLHRRDVRAQAEGAAWDVEVRTASTGTSVHLATAEVESLPASWTLRLFDLEAGTEADPAAHTLIAFGPDRPYRLRVLAGTPGWVESAAAGQLALPTSFVTDRAAPNPSRGATRLRFGIPRPVPVTLDVFDVRGNRIATLADGVVLPAGYHVRIWNGSDNSGRRVANGVYFAHLRAGERSATWRLLLLR